MATAICLLGAGKIARIDELRRVFGPSWHEDCRVSVFIRRGQISRGIVGQSCRNLEKQQDSGRERRKTTAKFAEKRIKALGLGQKIAKTQASSRSFAPSRWGWRFSLQLSTSFNRCRYES